MSCICESQTICIYVSHELYHAEILYHDSRGDIEGVRDCNSNVSHELYHAEYCIISNIYMSCTCDSRTICIDVSHELYLAEILYHDSRGDIEGVRDCNSDVSHELYHAEILYHQ